MSLYPHEMGKTLCQKDIILLSQPYKTGNMPNFNQKRHISGPKEQDIYFIYRLTRGAVGLSPSPPSPVGAAPSPSALEIRALGRGGSCSRVLS